ncbi:hypothetical protein T03_5984 [Trichinella britovi]|uniref:Uncharacterized protein n=1 Tax=Trichinella britovi TaxID=45882 RepID=A0A0V1CWV5_TRIBR|nr:hypothetical protein T03_5984 [Trichinella britovi]
MHMKKKEEKWIKPRSVSERFWIGWIESFAGPLRSLTPWRRYDLAMSSVESSSLQRHNTQTNKRLMFRYYYWKTLILSIVFSIVRAQTTQ